jgi:hypothetical protein
VVSICSGALERRDDANKLNRVDASGWYYDLIVVDTARGPIRQCDQKCALHRSLRVHTPPPPHWLALTHASPSLFVAGGMHLFDFSLLFEVNENARQLCRTSRTAPAPSGFSTQILQA